MRRWVLLVLGCWGCAGNAAKPGASPTPLAAVAAEPAPVERRPYAELVAAASAEAAALPGIWLEVNDAAQLLGKVPPAVQGHPLLVPFKDLSTLARGMLGADVGSIIDLSQPFDMVMALPKAHEEPPPVFAFRVSAPDVIERGQAGLTLRRLEAGVWQLGDEPQPAEAEEPEAADEQPEDEDADTEPEAPRSSRLPCLLAHAPPPVGYRVLCGPRLDAVQKLAPFLLRELPRQGADLHLEVGGPAYRAAIDQALAQLKTQSKTEAETLSGSNKFGAELGLAIVETLGAHDRVSLDARVTAAGAELQMDVGFPQSPATAALQSWVLAASSKGLPQSFGLLPSDNGCAFSFAGLGKDTAQSFLPAFADRLLTDMAQEFVLTAQQQRELTDSFVGVVPGDAHFSLAAGADADSIERALNSDAVQQADKAQRPLPAAAVKDLQKALAGWIAIGVDVPPKQYLPAIERMLRADQIPMVRRPGMPRKDTEREDSSLKREPVATRGLPTGTLHIVSRVRPAKTYRPPLDGSEPPILPFDSHWLIVPDGQRVWIVSARDEALAGARALAVLRGGKRLADDADVRDAVARPLLGAVSFNLAGTRLQALDWDSSAQRNAARLQFELFGKMLHTANAPMLVTLEGLPHPAGSAPGFDVRARLHVSQTALLQLMTGLPDPRE